ncbi:MAG TPA: hypothetical protein VI197_20525, partial [Polyangiaceae bacterium]
GDAPLPPLPPAPVVAVTVPVVLEPALVSPVPPSGLAAPSVVFAELLVFVAAPAPEAGPGEPVELAAAWLLLVTVAVVLDEVTLALVAESSGSLELQQESPSPSATSQRCGKGSSTKSSMTNLLSFVAPVLTRN